MSRKNKIHIGEILKAHNALFSYIKDPYGFRIGVVVMMKGQNRDNPKVGWALFDETNNKQYGKRINTLKEIPVADEHLNNILERAVEIFKLIPDTDNKENPSMLGIYNEVQALKRMKLGSPELRGFHNDALTAKGKADLISLAITRANTNRENYFACTSVIPGDRCDQSEVDWKLNWIPINRPDDSLIIKSPILAQTIKKAVREAEYRAWRYFKYERGI